MTDVKVVSVLASLAMGLYMGVKFQADDNTFADPRSGRELVEAVARENVRWFAETDISVAQDAELLRLIAHSGCRQILVGLETPTERGLDRLELRSNWKYRKRDHYRKAIEQIQSCGITLSGCFVVGLNGDAEEFFELVRELYRPEAVARRPSADGFARVFTPQFRRKELALCPA